jgi:hypothetical protein
VISYRQADLLPSFVQKQKDDAHVNVPITFDVTFDFDQDQPKAKRFDYHNTEVHREDYNDVVPTSKSLDEKAEYVADRADRWLKEAVAIVYRKTKDVQYENIEEIMNYILQKFLDDERIQKAVGWTVDEVNHPDGDYVEIAIEVTIL